MSDVPRGLRAPTLLRRHRRIAAAAVAAAATVTALVAATMSPASASLPATPSGWTQVFADDFTGSAGSRLDGSRWLYDIGHGYPGGASNWGTGEIEYMTDSTANVYQDGSGNLVIKPLRDGAGNWTSGRVETQKTDIAAPAGGKMRVEARIAQPNVTGAAAAGYWPAFWMLGAEARGTGATGWPRIGEIDILENINGRPSVFAALHCGTNPGGPCNETTGIGSGERSCAGCLGSFHTYAMEYDRSVSPEQLRYYLDGNNYFTITSNQVDATTWNNALHHGFFIILNVAIGGGFPAAFGGGPTAATQSGVPMLVDYVAAYTAGGGTTPPPTGTGGSITTPSGFCLDNNAASTANGNKIQIWDCNGSAAQKWTFVEAGTTLHVQGKCLDIPGGGTANGLKLQLWDCNNTAAQVWIPRNGGYYNPQSNRCLDNPNNSTTRGTQVQIWDCNGTNAQKWTLH